MLGFVLFLYGMMFRTALSPSQKFFVEVVEGKASILTQCY